MIEVFFVSKRNYFILHVSDRHCHGWLLLACSSLCTILHQRAKVRVCEIGGEEKTTSISPSIPGNRGEREREIVVQKHLLFSLNFSHCSIPPPRHFWSLSISQAAAQLPELVNLADFSGRKRRRRRRAKRRGSGTDGDGKERDPHALLMPSQFGAEFFFRAESPARLRPSKNCQHICFEVTLSGFFWCRRLAGLEPSWEIALAFYLRALRCTPFLLPPHHI